MRPDTVLVEGLRLPGHWRDRPAWCVLEVGSAATGPGFFLSLWHAWRQDPRRPRVLHHVVLAPATAVPAIASASVDAVTDGLAALAAQLRAQCWGLAAGWHRLSFEHGQVLLTLCLGAPDALLREQRFEADSVLLSATTAADAVCDPRRLKSLLRCCRRGTRLAMPDAPLGLRQLLARSGFEVEHAATVPTGTGSWCWARFDPHWRPRRRHDIDAGTATFAPDAVSDAAPVVVIGAGLAGAAVAAALSRRGRRVCVLDAARIPATGASSLPAGLFAPHVSADDGVLSRLTRAGIRLTLQRAQDRLTPGSDWSPSGVLELRHDEDAARALDVAAGPAQRDWSEPASPQRRIAAGVPDSTCALWHARAGWIRPAALVRALLADLLIEFRGGTYVDRLVPDAAGWHVLDAQGAVLAESPLVVLAAGHRSGALAPPGSRLPLQPVAGQLSFAAAPSLPALAPFPVNGHGSFLPRIALGDAGPCWIAGASYRRGEDGTEPRAADHAENLSRLHDLLPRVADQVNPAFAQDRVRAWAGVRCTTPDRLPVVGALAPGLWISSALGSRGLSLALLCADLLVAQFAAEPWPLPPRLAKVLDARRFGRASALPDPID